MTELWLLNNDVDDTFLCVPAVKTEAELALMTKLYEKAGMMFDVEKTGIMLDDQLFSKIQHMSVPISQRDAFVDDYLSSLARECALMAEIDALRKDMTAKWADLKQTPPTSDLKQSPHIGKKYEVSTDNVKPFMAYDILGRVSAFNPLGGPDGGLSKQTRNSVLVLFNEKRMTSVAFNTPASVKNMRQLIADYAEYGVSPIIYIDCHPDVMTTVYNTFNAVLHPSIQSLRSKISFCEKYIKAMSESDINAVSDTEEEEETVLAIMRQKYVVTENIEDRMRAQDIFDFFSQNTVYLPFKIDTQFRNRLSKYLVKLGLTKKRYSDGYYYYGIIRRDTAEKRDTYDPVCEN